MNLTNLAFSTDLNAVQKLDALATTYPELSFALNAIAVEVDSGYAADEEREAADEIAEKEIKDLQNDLTNTLNEASALARQIEEYEQADRDDDAKIEALNAQIATLQREQDELLEENRAALNKLAAITQIADGKNCMAYFDAQHAQAMQAANACDRAERDRAAMVRALQNASDQVGELGRAYSGKYKKTFLALAAGLWQHSKAGALVEAQRVAA